MRPSISVCFRLLVVALTLWVKTNTARAAETATVSLSGQVLGSSGKHPLFVALWDADGFLERPVQRARFEAGKPAVFQFRVPPGRWALSAFEDLNGNGILDEGLFGPTEPSGFSRPFRAWRKPRFEDVVVVVDRNTSDADIRLK